MPHKLRQHATSGWRASRLSNERRSSAALVGARRQVYPARMTAMVGSDKNIEIPYALKAGKVVHISEVCRGLGCGCICELCGDQLVARKGRARQHHFAHYRNSHCAGAAESMLHRLAKELLAKADFLALPMYVYRAEGKPRFGMRGVSIEEVIFGASRFAIKGAAVETAVDSIVPDLLLSGDGGKLIVEIVVSHPVDRAKLRRIRRLNIPTVEVILTVSDLLLSRVALARRIVEDTSIKKWLFHPDQRGAESNWIQARRKQQRIKRTSNSEAVLGPKRFLSGSQNRSRWWKQNEWAEQFNRIHKRYPSLDEVRDFEKRNQR